MWSWPGPGSRPSLGEDAEVWARWPPPTWWASTTSAPSTFLPVADGANRVVAADFVTTDDGSGIVHLAPAFGEIDREVGVAEGLPTLNPVDAAGAFEAGSPPRPVCS